MNKLNCIRRKSHSGTGTRTLVSCVKGKYANHLHHTGEAKNSPFLASPSKTMLYKSVSNAKFCIHPFAQAQRDGWKNFRAEGQFSLEGSIGSTTRQTLMIECSTLFLSIETQSFLDPSSSFCKYQDAALITILLPCPGAGGASSVGRARA